MPEPFFEEEDAAGPRSPGHALAAVRQGRSRPPLALQHRAAPFWFAGPLDGRARLTPGQVREDMTLARSRVASGHRPCCNPGGWSSIAAIPAACPGDAPAVAARRPAAPGNTWRRRGRPWNGRWPVRPAALFTAHWLARTALATPAAAPPGWDVGRVLPRRLRRRGAGRTRAYPGPGRPGAGAAARGRAPEPGLEAVLEALWPPESLLACGCPPPRWPGLPTGWRQRSRCSRWQAAPTMGPFVRHRTVLALWGLPELCEEDHSRNGSTPS